MLRQSKARLLAGLFVTLVVAGLRLPPVHAAQIQNPIQAAKDAYNKAKQQQAQPKPTQPSNAAPGQPANSGSAAPAPSSASATGAVAPTAVAPTAVAPGADCCTPAAMKKVAASLGFVDIVGIKLGMTPEQAVAAVKAYNPSLKIETLTARLEHPSNPGTFVRVPYTINAYSGNSRQDLGPVEWIGMQFTLQPGPPLLAKVVRYTGFVTSQPLMASNLLESLHKKYGQNNYSYGGDALGWVYDSNGKLVTRVSSQQGICAGDGYATGVAGGGPVAHQGGETGAGVSLSNTSDPSNPALTNLPEAGPDCFPVVWVVANNVGEGIAPNSQETSMTVTMESGALMYMSRKAVHAWLQAEADGKAKQENDAAAGRSGPKL